MDGNLPGDSQAFIAASRWGLDEVIDVYGRALGAFARIEASTECCFPDELHAELEAARAAARRATHALARLPVDEATDLERRLRLVERALEICNGVTDALVVDERRWEASAVNRFMDPGVRLAEGTLPFVFADVLPVPAEPEIPPDQVAEWLRRLHQILSDFVNRITNTNGTPERAAALARARELLETLRRYIAAVLGGGR